MYFKRFRYFDCGHLQNGNFVLHIRFLQDDFHTGKVPEQKYANRVGYIHFKFMRVQWVIVVKYVIFSYFERCHLRF